MSLPWENYLAVLELLSLVCSSAFPRGNLSTCLSDTPILGNVHVLLYPLDTVPTVVITILITYMTWILLTKVQEIISGFGLEFTLMSSFGTM